MVVPADPMPFLYHAAYLNDKGCVLMESGQQHEAFETFIASLNSVTSLTHVIEAHTCQRHLQKAHSMRKESCASPRAPGSILCSDQQQLQRTLSYPGSYYSANQLEQPHNFVYNQAFRFTASQEVVSLFSRPEDAAHYIKLYRAILAFNSALSFHQRSIGVVESVKRKAEAVASGLYLDALNLLQDCDVTLDVYRVMAAAINNAAMLFYEMQDFVKFEVFQGELHLLLVDMESSFPRSLERHCLQCLFFNATLLSPPRTAAAA